MFYVAVYIYIYILQLIKKKTNNPVKIGKIFEEFTKKSLLISIST